MVCNISPQAPQRQPIGRLDAAAVSENTIVKEASKLRSYEDIAGFANPESIRCWDGYLR